MPRDTRYFLHDDRYDDDDDDDNCDEDMNTGGKGGRYNIN